jgi:hypothetical protein
VTTPPRSALVGKWEPAAWERVHPEWEGHDDLPEWELEHGEVDRLALRFPSELYLKDWLARRLCTRCKEDVADTRYDDGLCDYCRKANLCAICGKKAVVSKHRCNTCRMYYARHGIERPKKLADRQGALNLRRPLKPGEIALRDIEYNEIVVERLRVHDADANIRDLYD